MFYRYNIYEKKEIVKTKDIHINIVLIIFIIKFFHIIIVVSSQIFIN
jgi:hypothetical protein